MIHNAPATSSQPPRPRHAPLTRAPHTPARIGLTGGIASGKSTVAAGFAALGVPVLDADAVAHELVEPGQPALHRLVERLGADILDPRGRLNRANLRARVFADPPLRAWLEGLLHPQVLAVLTARSAVLQAPYVVWEVPLLLEAGWQGQVDRILVVDLPEAVQRARLLARDALPPAQVEAILARQTGRAARLAQADDTLDNRLDRAALKRHITALHQDYLRRFKAA